MGYVERTLGFRTRILDDRDLRLENNSLPLPKLEGDDRAQARALATLYSHPVIKLFADTETFRIMGKEHALVICNHKSDIDWLVGWVLAQVPLAMDLLLAQLNRACIYTVPKHITYSKTLFKTKEAYRLAIGYKDEDGELESEEKYVERVDSYMRLYGALV